jgi:hypothetical protein
VPRCARVARVVARSFCTSYGADDPPHQIIWRVIAVDRVLAPIRIRKAAQASRKSCVALVHCDKSELIDRVQQVNVAEAREKVAALPRLMGKEVLCTASFTNLRAWFARSGRLLRTIGSMRLLVL